MKPLLTRRRFLLRLLLAALHVSALACAARPAHAAEPILYSVRFPAPETHYAEVEAAFPTGRRTAIELMMPVAVRLLGARSDDAIHLPEAAR